MHITIRENHIRRYEMKINKTLRLEEELIKKIQVIASKEKRNFTNMVEVLLDRAVKK